MIIGLPDGSKRLELGTIELEPGDVVWHDGERYVVGSVVWQDESAVVTIGQEVEAHLLDADAESPRSTRGSSPVSEERFETLLEQVRDLHRRTDEITRSKTRVHEHIRARLTWSDPPSLPPDQRKLADEVVDALDTPRLSSTQSRKLWQAYFDR